MSSASVQVETRLACKDGLLRLGSKEAQLASRSFWGKEMLQQRLCDLAEESKRRPVPISSCFPSLRRHPQSATDSTKERHHAQAHSDWNGGESSASDGSVSNSPLLARRQPVMKRSKTRLGTRTYRPAPASEQIFRSNSEELLPRPPSNPPPIRIGSKDARLASASFWGAEMLQKRLVDLAAESPLEKSDRDSKPFVSLPPLMDHHYHRPIARPRTGFGFYNSWDGVSSWEWWR